MELQSKAKHFILGLILLVFLPGVLHSENVTMSWNPNTEPDLAGYKLYYGLSSRDYSVEINTGNTTNYVVGGLDTGVMYYFALKAYDLFGNVSDFSEEISYEIMEGAGGSLELLNPDGGEELNCGDRYKIQWEVVPEVEEIKIWLSTDAGANWFLVKKRTNNDGGWRWDIPEVESERCLLRIEEYDNPSVFGRSEGFFTILNGTVDIEDEKGNSLPRSVVLNQNYPNPFNPMTTISFSVPPADEKNSPQYVTMTIYDSRGRKVKNLLERDLQPGNHSVCWDGRAEMGEPSPSGIYFYALSVGVQAFPPRKMVLAR
jgi:hypothetical protein